MVRRMNGEGVVSVIVVVMMMRWKAAHILPQFMFNRQNVNETSKDIINLDDNYIHYVMNLSSWLPRHCYFSHISYKTLSYHRNYFYSDKVTRHALF